MSCGPHPMGYCRTTAMVGVLPFLGGQIISKGLTEMIESTKWVTMIRSENRTPNPYRRSMNLHFSKLGFPIPFLVAI
jgi:hypothetical protein